MLIKLFFTSEDYEKSLRQRRLAALAFLGWGWWALPAISCWSPAAPFPTMPRASI